MSRSFQRPSVFEMYFVAAFLVLVIARIFGFGSWATWFAAPAVVYAALFALELVCRLLIRAFNRLLGTDFI